MSRLAKATLAASLSVTSGIIYYVHYSQKRDRERMKEGILIDMARQDKKRQNIHQLELQSDLTKILRRQQKERDKNEQLQTMSEGEANS